MERREVPANYDHPLNVAALSNAMSLGDSAHLANIVGQLSKLTVRLEA